MENGECFTPLDKCHYLVIEFDQCHNNEVKRVMKCVGKGVYVSLYGSVWGRVQIK